MQQFEGYKLNTNFREVIRHLQMCFKHILQFRPPQRTCRCLAYLRGVDPSTWVTNPLNILITDILPYTTIYIDGLAVGPGWKLTGGLRVWPPLEELSAPSGNELKWRRGRLWTIYSLITVFITFQFEIFHIFREKYQTPTPCGKIWLFPRTKGLIVTMSLVQDAIAGLVESEIGLKSETIPEVILAWAALSSYNTFNSYEKANIIRTMDQFVLYSFI